MISIKSRLYSQLYDLMESSFGLLNGLLSLQVLTRRQYTKIRTGYQVGPN